MRPSGSASGSSSTATARAGRSSTRSPEPRAVTIGRRPEADVSIPWDPEMSRLHAELEVRAGEWTITDDGLSQNGTWVNGMRLTGRRRLGDGDLVRVGRTMFAFCDPVPIGDRADARPRRAERHTALLRAAAARPARALPAAVPATARGSTRRPTRRSPRRRASRSRRWSPSSTISAARSGSRTCRRSTSAPRSRCSRCAAGSSARTRAAEPERPRGPRQRHLELRALDGAQPRALTDDSGSPARQAKKPAHSAASSGITSPPTASGSGPPSRRRLGSQNARSSCGFPRAAQFQSTIRQRPSRRHRLSLRMSRCTRLSPSSSARAAASSSAGRLSRARRTRRGRARGTAQGRRPRPASRRAGRPPPGDGAARAAASPRAARRGRRAPRCTSPSRHGGGQWALAEVLEHEHDRAPRPARAA